MEKLSLNDLLALLLPGLFFIISAQAANFYCPKFISFGWHALLSAVADWDALRVTIYFFGCVVTGALLNRISFLLIAKKRAKLYNKVSYGLYAHTGKLYDSLELPAPYTSFFNRDCQAIFGQPYKPANQEETRGDYFDYAFYYVLNHQEEPEMRTQQAYYFLFRNLFLASGLMSALLAVLSLTVLATHGWQGMQPLMGLLCLHLAAGYVVFAPIGRWYRKRMVRYVFTSYYMLRNK